MVAIEKDKEIRVMSRQWIFWSIFMKYQRLIIILTFNL